MRNSLLKGGLDNYAGLNFQAFSPEATLSERDGYQTGFGFITPKSVQAHSRLAHATGMAPLSPLGKSFVYPQDAGYFLNKHMSSPIVEVQLNQ